MTVTRTRTVTGYVDSTVLFHEYGETSGPLQVYASVAELKRENACVCGEPHCFPVLVTVSYTLPDSGNPELEEAAFKELFALTWSPDAPD